MSELASRQSPSRAERSAGDNSTSAYDVEEVRRDFPILKREVYGRPLVYLDTAASAQKPRQVISAMTEVMETCYANVHRGVHRLSQESTDLFENARRKVARFLNAGTEEIVFTRGATEAINLVAASFGEAFLEAGDEVVISALEHHSNIVPWQILSEHKGIRLKVVPMDDEGNFLLDDYAALLGPRTRLVAVTQVSNALGTVTPLAEIVALAKERGIAVLVDGCQAVPHAKVDLEKLGADFYVFSGHKLYGPNGVGVLYGRRQLLERMPPYQGGGEMITSVTMERSTYKAPPHRFEAGTPPIVEVIGLGAALDYVEGLGLERIHAHEDGLLAYAERRLMEIEGLVLLSRAQERASILSFTLDGVHPHDIGTVLDRGGVAVRAGHHCAQPVMDRLGVAATVRASIGLYTTRQEIDALAAGLAEVREIFG